MSTAESIEPGVHAEFTHSSCTQETDRSRFKWDFGPVGKGFNLQRGDS